MKTIALFCYSGGNFVAIRVIPHKDITEAIRLSWKKINHGRRTLLSDRH
jgi:hypothetical protein